MDKSFLPGCLIGIGIFVILTSGIPTELSFQQLGDSITGALFVVIGVMRIIKNKNNREEYNS